MAFVRIANSLRDIKYPLSAYIEKKAAEDIFLKKKAGGLLILLLLGFLVWGSQKLSNYVIKSSFIPSKHKAIKIVIDAGHGGKDGGKVGVNGVLESEINLQIADKVKRLLEEEQVEVRMTRTKGQDISGTKAEELQARVALIDQEQPALTVSIHQNSYKSPEVRGAQVFYYTHSEEGKKAAEAMQQALGKLDEENERQAKGNTTYYILRKTESPVIIVECGFLSNPEEAEKLCQEEYQEKAAECIKNGIFQYLGIDEN